MAKTSGLTLSEARQGRRGSKKVLLPFLADVAAVWERFRFGANAGTSAAMADLVGAVNYLSSPLLPSLFIIMLSEAD